MKQIWLGLLFVSLMALGSDARKARRKRSSKHRDKAPENLTGLKRVKKLINKTTRLKYTFNPMDCYLSMQVLPLEAYIETERLLIRLRFISNCLRIRDIVLITAFSVRVGEDLTKKDSVTLKLEIANKKVRMKFRRPIETAAKKEFRKLVYYNLKMKTDYFNGEFSTKSDNNFVLTTELTPYQLGEIKAFESPVYCGYNRKRRTMRCRIFNRGKIHVST